MVALFILMPGTGKTHVAKDVIKNELFNQILDWKQGRDYKVVSLQAVMVDLLKGDTMHHAFGILIRKRDSDGEVVIQQTKEFTNLKRLERTSWLKST